MQLKPKEKLKQKLESIVHKTGEIEKSWSELQTRQKNQYLKFLEYLIEGATNCPQTGKDKEYSWVYVSQKQGMKLTTKKTWETVRDNLIAVGLVRENPVYVPNVFSKSYKVDAEYWGEWYVEGELEDDVLVCDGFELDLGKVGAIWDELVKSRGWKTTSVKAQWTKCRNFGTNEPKRSPVDWRERNVFNMLPEEVRKLITFDDEKCVEVDLKNSFANIMTLLAEGKERVWWRNLCLGDMYVRIAGELGVSVKEAKIK